jgi:hypothetical protein
MQYVPQFYNVYIHIIVLKHGVIKRQIYLLLYQHNPVTYVVLEPRGLALVSKPNFRGLGLDIRPPGLGLGLDLECPDLDLVAWPWALWYALGFKVF